jgi:hypothetical protein
MNVVLQCLWVLPGFKDKFIEGSYPVNKKSKYGTIIAKRVARLLKTYGDSVKNRKVDSFYALM